MLQQEPLLELDDIQGNIIPGFNKDHQAFIGICIDDPAVARVWLGTFAGEISTASEGIQFRQLRRAMMARLGAEPQGLATTWVNAAFSPRGIALFEGQTSLDQFEDRAFILGLHARSSSLGDPTDGDDLEGSPKNWKFGGRRETTPDVFVVVAADLDQNLQEKVASILQTIRDRFTPGVRTIYAESGHNPPGDMAGKEHFGFKDGISQPGVRGLISRDSAEPLTPRLLHPEDPLAVSFSKPGQPLVWPGQFLFGYPSQDPLVPELSGKIRSEAPPWAKNGSFLVVRRLRQHVGLFHDFVRHETARLKTELAFFDLTEAELGATIVGRWQSGAPIARSRKEDNAGLAKNDLAINHFGFDQPASHLRFADPNTPPDPFEMCPDDRNGARCPMFSHIRKVNPRDITTEQGSATDVLTRRILRRGIPYGPVFSQEQGDDVDRGLMFLCYQTSIENQFEFLSRNWMNAPAAPEEEPGGRDLILGQNRVLGEGRRKSVRFARETAGVSGEATLTASGEWVVPTAGGYFFAPSISTIRSWSR